MYNVSFHLKSFDLDSLAETQLSLVSLFSFLHLDQIKNQIKPKSSKKITVLRSPHIDKKSREQFQIVSHKKTLNLVIFNKNLLLFLLDILKDIHCRGVEIVLVIEFKTF